MVSQRPALKQPYHPGALVTLLILALAILWISITGLLAIGLFIATPGDVATSGQHVIGIGIGVYLAVLALASAIGMSCSTQWAWGPKVVRYASLLVLVAAAWIPFASPATVSIVIVAMVVNVIAALTAPWLRFLHDPD